MAAPPGSLLAGAKVHRPHAGACRPGEEHNGAAYIGLLECTKPFNFHLPFFFFFLKKIRLGTARRNSGPQEGATLGR